MDRLPEEKEEGALGDGRLERLARKGYQVGASSPFQTLRFPQMPVFY